ncbi:MAG: hypothetical protein GXY06_04130 [Clostridiaceae bacterium]|nr:hypothetical protein [Clostridiaceae bacterium]
MSAIKLGLIGNPLGHSMSPFIHDQIMSAVGIAASYELYDIRPEDLSKYIPFLLRDLHGFNVTIPYKEEIMRYLSDRDDSVSTLKAVNTVFDGRGYNTDLIGFRAVGIDMKDRRVLLLGAGGVARVMAFEAATCCKSLTIQARNIDKATRLADDIRQVVSREDDFTINVIDNDTCPSDNRFDVVLNATPVGMWPKCAQIPACAAVFGPGTTVFDTIYNPPATKMILQARKAGAKAIGGLSMLVNQAIAAQKIWFPEVSFPEHIEEQVMALLPKKILARSPMKIILTGYMGSGKSTVGQLLAHRLGISYFDTDQEVERVCGMPISKVFAQEGEAGFRRVEAAVFAECVNQSGAKTSSACVISTGGGLITQESNQKLLSQDSVLNVFLDASMDCIWKRISSESHRPLIQYGTEEADRFRKAAELYDVRLPIYDEYCDVKVSADDEPEVVVRNVLKALGYGG